MRSRLVRGSSLSDIAEVLGLGKQIALGEGELKSGAFRRSSIRADALEAVFGAIYLDGGFDACRQLILELFNPLIEALPSAEELKDPKTRLQEWLQARQLDRPVYRLESEQGADHQKTFHVSCHVAEPEQIIYASGNSRRRAEQTAAAEMLTRLTGSE